MLVVPPIPLMMVIVKLALNLERIGLYMYYVHCIGSEGRPIEREWGYLCCLVVVVGGRKVYFSLVLGCCYYMCID